LRRGAEPAAVVSRIEERVPEVTPSVRFMLGTALYEAGVADLAEEQFRGVLERQPDSDPARLALAEALLSQARLDEAAEVARAIAGESRLAAPAARTELFALVTAGADAGDALGRARTCGLPAAEAELFRAWAATGRGEPLPAALPTDAAPLLLTM